jgi:hypothetical protein
MYDKSHTWGDFFPNVAKIKRLGGEFVQRRQKRLVRLEVTRS